VVASGNPHKLKELISLLKSLRINVIPLTALGKVPKVREDGKSFQANAMKKARVYSRLSDKLTLADDSGLCVKSLRGRPGVYSARYAGPGCTYDDNNRKLLRELEGKPPSKRRATFQCTAALYSRGRKVEVLTGKCAGTIAERPRGRNGFGYDPVFIPLGYRKSFAEMSCSRKNRISHRAKALEAVKRFLKRHYG